MARKKLDGIRMDAIICWPSDVLFDHESRKGMRLLDDIGVESVTEEDNQLCNLKRTDDMTNEWVSNSDSLASTGDEVKDSDIIEFVADGVGLEFHRFFPATHMQPCLTSEKTYSLKEVRRFKVLSPILQHLRHNPEHNQPTTAGHFDLQWSGAHQDLKLDVERR